MGLGEPSAGGLPPSVIVFEEAVVKMCIEFISVTSLIKTLRDVLHRVQVLRPHLRNVQINHERVVAEQLPLFLLGQARRVEVARLGDVLVRQDVRRLAVDVAWCVEVVHL